MFVEKYRPKKFKDVIGQEKIAKPIAQYIRKNGIVPNLLFIGDPGIGKTTLAHVIARKLFGDDFRNSMLELNASSDRGIAVVRERIQEFARTKSFSKFKLVFLDEASEITKDAQHALRRIMEVNSDNCRFILSCNYPEKIVDAIKSRCTQYKFKRIKPKDLKLLANKILEAEGATVKKKDLKLIILDANGDARRLLNLLEAHVTGREVEGLDESISDIFDLSVGEFQALAYRVDGDRLLNAMVEEGLKLKSRKAVHALADCDARFRLGCIRSLQLIDAFIKIKEAL